MVYAEGSPEADAYTNKENQASATLRMRVQNLQLLGGGEGAPQTNGSTQSMATSGASSNNATSRMSEISESADDLPF
jgi:single-stranded DNA-binding protein